MFFLQTGELQINLLNKKKKCKKQVPITPLKKKHYSNTRPHIMDGIPPLDTIKSYVSVDLDL